MNKKLIVVVVVLAAALGAAAVWLNPKQNPKADKRAGHNAQDVSFAQLMIAHHRQAIAMAELAAGRSSNGQVKQLAANIKAAQSPEITLMTGWLKDWGQPAEVPTTSTPGMAGHDTGADVPGTMTAAEMTALAAAKEAEFDKLFLQTMIKHHQGAIDMAQTEQSFGQFGAAKDLAAKIAGDQQKEIESIKQIQSQLGL